MSLAQPYLCVMANMLTTATTTTTTPDFRGRALVG